MISTLLKRGHLPGLSSKDSTYNADATGAMRLIPDGEDLLEEISRMATHSSILSWKIPWTEEPGGLQSTGLQSDPTEATEHAGTTQKEPIGGSA